MRLLLLMQRGFVYSVYNTNEKSDTFLCWFALFRQVCSHFSHLAARPTITIYTSRLYFDAITLAQVRSEISEETAWVTQSSNGSQASI